MNFEYDARKSASNKEKHGIDFEEAKALWKDRGLVEIPVRTIEPRSTVTGKIGVNYWTAAITYRGANIRIISVRRARVKEKEKYEKINS